MTTTIPPEPITLAVCDDCAEETAETHVIDDREVCPTCVDNYWSCDACGCCVETDGLRQTADGDHICDDCTWRYTECWHCERLYTETLTTASGHEICQSCYAYNYHRCDRCDDVVHDDEGCECSDDGDDADGLIHYYSYAPYPQFHGEGPVFLGMELEVSTPYREMHSAAVLASNELGSLGYLKEDSSINYGFEMVTHPMSHAYAAESYPWDMLRKLDEMGCSAEENGLHVHVSRAGFSDPTHIFRWFKFLHRNRDAVTRVARRDSDQWAPWRESDRANSKYYAKGERYDANRRRVGYDRYAAVNVTNSATFEVRVFAGSLVASEVRAALDLVAGSVEYTRQLTTAEIAQRDGWSWDAFLTWASERPEYAALVEMFNAEMTV